MDNKDCVAILATEYSTEFDAVRKTYLDEGEELDQSFDELRQKAMVNSYHKYGAVAKNYVSGRSGKALVNCLESLRMRISKYRVTGNTEFLVDVANQAMIEFMYPQNKLAHRGHTTGVSSIRHLMALELNLEMYEKTGNTEYLAMVANDAMREFDNPQHPNRHYVPTSDKESPGLAGKSIGEIRRA